VRKFHIIPCLHHPMVFQFVFSRTNPRPKMFTFIARQTSKSTILPIILAAKQYYFLGFNKFTIQNILLMALKLRILILRLNEAGLSVFIFVSLSRPESRIHDRHIGKVPLQCSISMRTQTYTQTYPNSIRVQRSINNKINFII